MTAPFKLEQAPEKGAPPPQNDGLNAYRAHPWMPPDATTPKPNVVADGQLTFPPLPTEKVTPTAATTPTDTSLAAALSLNSPTATDAAPSTTASTPPVDTRSAGMIAAITDQGQLSDPGMAPMWMRMAPNQYQGLIQQNYGESALNGFQPGVKVPGIDAPKADGSADNTADNSADVADALLTNTANGNNSPPAA